MNSDMSHDSIIIPQMTPGNLVCIHLCSLFIEESAFSHPLPKRTGFGFLYPDIQEKVRALFVVFI